MITILLFWNALNNGNNFTIIGARLVFKRFMVFNGSLYLEGSWGIHSTTSSFRYWRAMDLIGALFTVQWMRNWLYGCTQKVVDNGKITTCSSVTSVIPPGPYLRPALFNIFIDDTAGLSTPSESLQMTPSWVVPLTCLRDEVPSRGTWTVSPSAKCCTFEDFSIFIRKVINILQGNTKNSLSVKLWKIICTPGITWI